MPEGGLAGAKRRRGDGEFDSDDSDAASPKRALRDSGEALTAAHFAGAYVEGAMSLSMMRAFIRTEGLRVNTNCGHGNRTKEDVFRDVQRALQRRAQAEHLIRANALVSRYPSRLGNVTFELLRDDDGHLDLQALRRFIRTLNLAVATNCGAGRTKENLYEEIRAELDRLHRDPGPYHLPILPNCDDLCHRCQTGTCVTSVMSRMREKDLHARAASPSGSEHGDDDQTVPLTDSDTASSSSGSRRPSIVHESWPCSTPPPREDAPAELHRVAQEYATLPAWASGAGAAAARYDLFDDALVTSGAHALLNLSACFRTGILC